MPILNLSPDDLTRLAREARFDLAGVAALGPQEGQGSAEPTDYLEQWIAAGHAGEMEYLKRRNDQGELLRSGVRAAVPWARSVIVCAVNYNAPGPLSIDPAPSGAGWIARYAWAGQRDAAGGELHPSDYHDTILSRLRALESKLHERVGEAFESRCYVDTGPLIERDLARLAGIGWIGKNTCTLNQQLGSWLFLGCIVTALDVAPASRATPAIDRCGTCRRCIEACPTAALIAPGQMDASRCIAYLTIEKRGPIAEELRAPMGRQVFGCDICQEVCPWNHKSAGRPASVPQRPAAVSLGESRPELINPALEWLADLSAEEFNRKFRGSPVKRTKRGGLLRNVAIAMGNSGDPSGRPRLEAWSAGDDPVLAEAAAWAIARLDQRE